MEWGINLIYKFNKISLRNRILITFTIIISLTIFIISTFVKITFQKEFYKYVDESNKSEVEHLIYDLKNIYVENEFDMDRIQYLGEDAIKKGIALEIYNSNNQIVWSIFHNEKILSNKTLNNIKENMIKIENNWESDLKEYTAELFDSNNNIIGYQKIIHYRSIYFMENDIEFLSIINKFMSIISFISLASVVIISFIIAKGITKSLEKVSIMAKKIEKGKYEKILGKENNIKEVDELISTINTLASKLNEQEKLRKQITTDISHELRTPLTSIQGHLDAIIDGIWEPTVERLVCIREEVLRLSDLVGELRKLTKYDTEDIKLKKSNVDLKELIQSAILNFQAIAKDRNILIHADLEEVVVWIDKNQFTQVIVNILSNAIKYSNDNSDIYIRLQKEKDVVKIEIEDFGIGIPEDEIQYLFERFYRVDKSRSKSTGGIGVGLTIAKSIVTEHEGDIEVKSKLNEGSNFIIRIPVKKQ